MILLAPSQMTEASQKTPDRVYLVYKVKPGDTLKKIARRFDVSVRAIRRANHLKTSQLRPGQRLKIPVPSKAQKRHASARCDAVYNVRPGDTLNAIARRCGVSAQRLLTYNHLSRASRLYVGQRLRIPAGQFHAGRDYLPAPAR